MPERDDGNPGSSGPFGDQVSAGAPGRILKIAAVRPDFPNEPFMGHAKPATKIGDESGFRSALGSQSMIHSYGLQLAPACLRPVREEDQQGNAVSSTRDRNADVSRQLFHDQ